MEEFFAERKFCGFCNFFDKPQNTIPDTFSQKF